MADVVKRRVLLVTIISSGLVFLDSSIVTVALPQIQRDLGITTAEQQWIASAYLLTLSALLLVGGRLSDMFGRLRLLRMGLVGYVLLSAVAAFAPNAAVLIGARALQGVAGALLVPTTLALINATFPAEERGEAIGTWAAWSGIATVLGPLVGGYLIDNVTWRLSFALAPALALAAFALSGPVPDSRDEHADRGFDPVGIALVVASLGALVFALIQAPLWGWTDAWVLASLVAGLVLLPAFVWWEGRARSPVMPYGLFANHNLAVANLVTFFVYAGLYGAFFYIPIYVQTALGISATIAAVIFIPITLLLFFLSPIAGRLNDRHGPRWLMFFGPLTGAAGIVLASFTGPGQLWTMLVPGIVVFGIGLGFTVTPVTATAIGSAEQRYSGVASGFNNGVSRVAGLIAIALMGVIVVQLWQAALGTAASGAPAEVADAFTTVRSQVFVTPSNDGLSPEQAEQVSEVATAASKTAFRNGMLLAAALVALGGVVSAIWIRPNARAGGGEAEPDSA